MNRPERVSLVDWNILQKKYKNRQKFLKKRLAKNYPVQYLIGNVDFFNTTIDINKSALIPRFETELLVEKVTKFIKEKSFQKLNILDICTGSGCIAISLAKYFNLEVTALDISSKALKIAKKNARKNKTKIHFKKQNILKKALNGKYNVIICNPPYVSKTEEVDFQITYEPEQAIYANQNGLEFYENILPKIKKNLESSFFLAFEMGESQGKYLLALAKRYYPLAKIWLEKDYNDKNRYLFITNL